MAQSDQENSGSSRWWEFYVVRYGTGTVLGGIIFFFLCKVNTTLTPLLFSAGIDKGKLDASVLTLLAGYGFAYCYIASAPILVLHAGRFMIDISNKSYLPVVLLIIFPTIAGTGIFFMLTTPTGAIHIFLSLVFALTFIVVWPQYVIIGFTLFQTKSLLRFYKRLAEKRENAKGGLVDSYKHLREHGNSFSIVFLEIVLAIILFAVGNYHVFGVETVGATKAASALPYIIVILVWIIPAAMVWLVGTLLEHEFIQW